MGFRLTVKGKDTIYLGENIIRLVNVQLSTPTDSKAKSTDVAATMWVTGKLLHTEGPSNSDTLKLFEWAQVPAQSSEAYSDVIVEVVSSDKIFRKVYFPNAFVVDYSERYNDTAGVGEFSMTLRQKADRLLQVKAEGGLSLGV
ncbi:MULTISPECIES: hypothetical protein [Pelosinus]|uniref:Membrane-associated protease 1 n=1 Tax=Pelosinus fermentans B4 TaxID=1149862 RepID=I8RJH5_9FIRM|nr:MULTISPECIES: hypothetical protein [Pelosinus]EIW18310.1 hypothetical protein FB4_3484 [Pelosinus fermentans B4]EIW24296.1 hypothetical protein FA11_3485 [Pelosinus fermentans A11]OAM94258.1 hypothetical protein FR7_02276 [Pelosinus fermentans DSM 17108]SDR04398.1 hypothetical protein SAMN04515679_2379 [Pelosinus fermentans]